MFFFAVAARVHAATASTRASNDSVFSYARHSLGRTPRISLSDPGQKYTRASLPSLRAVTHKGSPPSHQNEAREEALSGAKLSFASGSKNRFATMPWVCSFRPVTRL